MLSDFFNAGRCVDLLQRYSDDCVASAASLSLQPRDMLTYFVELSHVDVTITFGQISLISACFGEYECRSASTWSCSGEEPGGSTSVDADELDILHVFVDRVLPSPEVSLCSLNTLSRDKRLCG